MAIRGPDSAGPALRHAAALFRLHILGLRLGEPRSVAAARAARLQSPGYPAATEYPPAYTREDAIHAQFVGWRTAQHYHHALDDESAVARALRPRGSGGTRLDQ